MARGTAASVVSGKAVCRSRRTHRKLLDQMWCRMRVICRYVWACGGSQRRPSLFQLHAVLTMRERVRVRAGRVRGRPGDSGDVGGGRKASVGQSATCTRPSMSGLPDRVRHAVILSRTSHVIRGVVLYSINRGDFIRSSQLIRPESLPASHLVFLTLNNALLIFCLSIKICNLQQGHNPSSLVTRPPFSRIHGNA